MTRQLFILTFYFAFIVLISCGQTLSTNEEKIVKIEMNLSAFGVESDSYPSIDAVIDFSKDTSVCVKSYYNPDYKGSTYSLNKKEMKLILVLLKISDIQKLNTEYTVPVTDQPSSKTIIYTTKTSYTINDNGLKGEYPLQELYNIVYKF